MPASDVQYIVIRTCQRPYYLRRILASLARRRTDSAFLVLVLDDSPDARNRELNAQTVASAQRRFAYSVHYLGREVATVAGNNRTTHLFRRRRGKGENTLQRGFSQVGDQ